MTAVVTQPSCQSSTSTPHYTVKHHLQCNNNSICDVTPYVIGVYIITTVRSRAGRRLSISQLPRPHSAHRFYHTNLTTFHNNNYSSTIPIATDNGMQLRLRTPQISSSQHPPRPPINIHTTRLRVTSLAPALPTPSTSTSLTSSSLHYLLNFIAERQRHQRSKSSTRCERKQGPWLRGIAGEIRCESPPSSRADASSWALRAPYAARETQWRRKPK
eukprot:5912078-Amphidinium_carterae.2